MARGPLAGAAGPGKFSKRTDMDLGSIAYGEGVETKAIQQGAPMARTADVQAARASDVRAAAQQGPMTPLYAPSQRPEEPITTGIAMGDGAGPEVLGINNDIDTLEDKERMVSYLPALETLAASPNSSQAFRNYVRMLRANLL